MKATKRKVHISLRELSRAFYDTANAFQELTDAVSVFMIFLDELTRYRKLSADFQNAIDSVKYAMEKVS